MADQPSRGFAALGPCEVGPSLKTSKGRSSRVQRFDSTKGYPGEGPVVPFWSPLLDGNVKNQSLQRYAAELRHFVEFVRERLLRGLFRLLRGKRAGGGRRHDGNAPLRHASVPGWELLKQVGKDDVT